MSSPESRKIYDEEGEEGLQASLEDRFAKAMIGGSTKQPMNNPSNLGKKFSESQAVGMPAHKESFEEWMKRHLALLIVISYFARNSSKTIVFNAQSLMESNLVPVVNVDGVKLPAVQFIALKSLHVFLC